MVRSRDDHYRIMDYLGSHSKAPSRPPQEHREVVARMGQGIAFLPKVPEGGTDNIKESEERLGHIVRHIP